MRIKNTIRHASSKLNENRNEKGLGIYNFVMQCVSILKEDNTLGTKYLAVLRMQVSANPFFCLFV